MAALDTDTIAAIATPPGQGGIGVVRLSGPDARAIAESLTNHYFKPRSADFVSVKAAGELIDEGIGIFFAGPNSFTGEDVVELQLHGSPVVLQQVLDVCREAGARLARPGEYTERAFLNDKIDLAQAEAVADLIASASQGAARAAVRSLAGEFSKAVYGLTDRIEHMRMLIEATIDFPRGRRLPSAVLGARNVERDRDGLGQVDGTDESRPSHQRRYFSGFDWRAKCR